MEVNLIYKITNNINGKVYIGLTDSFNRRMTQHSSVSGSPSSDGYFNYFYRAVRKYGWDNFTKEILEENLSREEANIKETFYINKYQSNEPECGYNLTEGGENARTHSELSLDDVEQIYELIKTTSLSLKNIAQKFNVSSTTISYINTGKAWINAKNSYPLRECNKTKENILQQIAEDLVLKELTMADIAKKYGVAKTTVQKFNSGLHHNGFWDSYPIRKGRKLRGGEY